MTQMPSEHRTRRSILEKEATWRLTTDALERVAEGEGALRMPLAEISELRLSYDPTRFETSRYRCDVTSKRNGRALIVSVSYVSPANFENRAATYVPFVRAIALAVAHANPACKFVAGRPLARYLASHAFLLLALVLLVSVLYATGVPVIGVVAIKVALIAAFVPTMIRYARANRPRVFDPLNVPEDVLPPLR
jgi:hypothetical protein